ncbi:MAG: hypothetical protein WBC60_05490 [Cognaticolwellia sp.]
MNLHPQFEKQIRNEIAKNDPSTVGEVWDCFKTVFNVINVERPDSLIDFGIQAEVFHGSENSKPSFYFALHYRVSAMEDGEEYSFYELVYCDFDLSEVLESVALKEESIDVCEVDCSISALFSKIENWPAFSKLKNLVLPLAVYSDEV